VWSMPSAPGAASQDDHLVVMLPGGRLRVAVLDGVTPAPDTPEIAGMDGAAAAAGILRAALRGEDDVLHAAAAAGRFFRQPHLGGRSQPQACAVICDLPAAPEAGPPSIVRFGDCEAWARVGDSWRPVVAGSCLTRRAAQRVARWHRAYPEATLDQVIDADAVLTAEPSSFVTAPVGRLPGLRPEWGVPARFDELVLASDGARLDAGRLRDLDEWLTAMPPDGAAKPFDDATVARIRPSVT
jgi:hypothetical protein